MSARLPLLHKTPFVLDERPLYEATSPHAGLLSVSRVYRALGLPALVGANLALRKRQRGFAEAQFIESISLLQTVGGECPEDMHLLAGDDCLARGLGYGPPKATAVREFLERFPIGIHFPAPNGRRGMPRRYASVGRGRLPGTRLGLWSTQSDGGAGVFGTLPRSEVGDPAAQAGSAEELHFPFEPAGQRLAGSAQRAGAADCQAV